MNQKDFLKTAYEKGYRVSKSGKVISPQSKSIRLGRTTAYLKFSVKVDGKRRTIFVHRLQALQKYGPRLFEKGMVVRHLDGNVLNNSWENISVGSQSENMMDRDPNARAAHAEKATAKTRKLSNQEVLSLREDRSNGFTYKQLMEKYELSKSTVSYIVNRRTYKHVEYGG